METLSKIKSMYSQIPGFKCKPGCHDCCGLVPWAKVEWEQIKDKRNYTTFICPYVGDKGCDIYEHRPLMCRLFGAVNDALLKCPNGCGPEKKLSRKKAKQLIRDYERFFINAE